MKGLVIRQPWAELIASGRKTIEVRSRRTLLRDEFLIVAGMKLDPVGMALHGARPAPVLPASAHLGVSEETIARLVNPPVIAPAWDDGPPSTASGALNGILPTGCAIAIARVFKIEPFHSLEHERAALLPWNGESQLWAWHLGNVRRIKPFAVRGMPGFFEVPTPR